MSDAEVICKFMDWARTTFRATPESGHLGLCHEFEERLTDIQWLLYETHLDEQTGLGSLPHETWRYIHATAEQKIKALAAVIRATQGDTV